MHQSMKTLVVCLALALTAGCAGQQVVVPALTPTATNTRQVGRFVWYDLLTDDLEGTKRFYGELFGWTFGDASEDASEESVYTVILHRGKAIGGIAFTPKMEREVNSSQWVSNLSVADVDRAADYVQRMGGIVHAEPQELPDRGRVAMVRDPQGAVVLLVRSQAGDPPEGEAEVGEWLWTELWTRDATASISFYEGLVGYEHQAYDAPGTPGQYFFLTRDGNLLGGVLEYAFEYVEPNWLPYVRVEDPGDLVRRVEGLGGRVLIAPREDIRGGSVAVIADPSGAALTIQKWPVEGIDR